MKENALFYAIAFYQNQERYAWLKEESSPIPSDVNKLFRLLASKKVCFSFARYLKVEPSELRQIVFQFVEQVLFLPNASPFRILGLPPQADLKDCKVNYRLLMQIFHPDRLAIEGFKEATDHSARISEAYRQIKKLSIQSNQARQYHDSKKNDAYHHQAKIFYTYWNDKSLIEKLSIEKSIKIKIILFFLSVVLFFSCYFFIFHYKFPPIVQIKPEQDRDIVDKSIIHKTKIRRVFANELLRNFEAAYKEKSMENLFLLFHDDALFNGVSAKKMIFDRHTAWFEHIDVKRIKFRDFYWRQQNGFTMGKGKYTVHYTIEGISILVRSGNVKIKLLKVKSRFKISLLKLSSYFKS